MFVIVICIYEYIFQDSHSRNSVSERFLAAENQRARELERLIDSHIEQLKIGTEATLRKYNVKRWCHVPLWCNLFLCSSHLMRTGWFSAAKQEISVIYKSYNVQFRYAIKRYLRSWGLNVSGVNRMQFLFSMSTHLAGNVSFDITANETSWKWLPILHVYKNIIIGCVNVCIRTQ